MKLLASLVTAFAIFSQHISYGFVIQPSPPIQVANDSSVNTSGIPVVQTNPSGEILVIWQSNNDILASFSSNLGVSWTPDTPIVNNAALIPFLSANSKGFLLTWNDGNTGNPYSMFFNTQTKTWGPQTPIDTLLFPSTLIFSSSTPKGFLATFIGDPGNGYANLSSDGSTWQSTSQLIFSGVASSSVQGCGNANMLLATTVDSSGNLYVATSINGSSWNSSGVPIPLGGLTVFSNGSAGCAANSHGFLIAFPDSSLNLWSIFSSDGVHWTTPAPIAMGVAGCLYQTVILTGNDQGFITCWIDGTFTGQAAFTSTNGQTWETPVAFTPVSNVVNFFFYYGSSLTVSQKTSVFAWSDTNQNPFVSISAFPFTPSLTKREWGLNQPVDLKKPGKQLNN